MLREFAEYLLEFASTPWGPIALVAHAYFESFIIPLAHELFLIPVCLARPNLSLVFALMSTVASVCGITTGYFIGRWGGRNILKRILKPRLLIAAEHQIRKYDVWAIAIACMTPIPVKVFACLAGTVRMDLRKLIPIAFLARGSRFFITAIILYFIGEPAKEWILKYMDILTIIMFVFMAISFVVWSRTPHKLGRKKSVGAIHELPKEKDRRQKHDKHYNQGNS